MPDKNIKMDEEDLRRIEDIQDEFDELVWELGKREVYISQMKDKIEEHKEKKEEIEDQMEDLQEKYKKVSKELHKKYGSGVFDSETGELVERAE